MVELEFVPTDDELNAAREVLRRYPQLFGGGPPPNAEMILAEMHRRTGADWFNLQFGFRQPVNALEECDVKWLRGEISYAEVEVAYEAHANRPVDEEMLKTVFVEAERRIQNYSRFLVEVGDVVTNRRRPPVSDADEERLDRLVDEMRFKSKLFNEEMFTAVAFLQESRIEKGLSTAKAGKYLAGTAVELSYRVTKRAAEFWRTARDTAHRSQTTDELAYPERAVALYYDHCVKSLPRPDELQILIEEEQLLARMCLNARIAPRPNAPLPTEVEPSKSEQPNGDGEVLLKIANWSDLAIGLDEKGQFWAQSPPPEPGQLFKKSLAVRLPLKGGRWKKVLTLFAQSETGHRARRGDLLQSLGFFSLAERSLDRDRRARPGEIEQGQVDALELRINVANRRLTTTLGDLRRELRDLIEVTEGPDTICLRSDGDFVESGFQARYLIQDESGRTFFGTPTQL